MKGDVSRRIEMGWLSLQQALRRLRNREKGFTLVELMVVVAIILILASIGMYAYQRSLAYAKETVCKTNLRALKNAVDMYVSDNEAFPASLGQLKPEYLEKAYAKAMEDRGWVKRVCFFLAKFDTSDHAYAQFLTYENLKDYGASQATFHCPADSNGGISYGINGSLAGERLSEVDRNEVLIADCENYTFFAFNELARRHNGKALAIKITGEIIEVGSGDTVNVVEKAEGTEPTGNEEYVTICHKPGTPAEKTLTVPKSALGGHLGHGDYEGPCK
jgi:prepilin-type N-terminal cleavage/methylation domain-containing protein